jgi:hypothetical protein
VRGGVLTDVDAVPGGVLCSVCAVLQFILLNSIEFCFVSLHPYEFLFLALKRLYRLSRPPSAMALPLSKSESEAKELAAVGWTLIHESMKTSLCLFHKPQTIAIGNDPTRHDPTRLHGQCVTDLRARVWVPCGVCSDDPFGSPVQRRDSADIAVAAVGV